LTAPARAGLHHVRVGAKKRDSKSNKETEMKEVENGSNKRLTSTASYKEKLYLDKANPDILRNEITTYDHALTRPWTVSRFYKREHHPIYEEYNCTEDNRWVAIGGELYLADSEGYDADPEGPVSARPEIPAEVFSAGEEVTTRLHDPLPRLRRKRGSETVML
jgi:hypothetical protein